MSTTDASIPDIQKRCVICGNLTPNPYGECGCSFSLDFLQDRIVYDTLKRIKCKAIPYWALTHKDFI
jgi:hypothetical protein